MCWMNVGYRSAKIVAASSRGMVTVKEAVVAPLIVGTTKTTQAGKDSEDVKAKVSADKVNVSFQSRSET